MSELDQAAPKKRTEDIKAVTREFSFALSVNDYANKAKQVGKLQQELADATLALGRAKNAFKGAESEIKEAMHGLVYEIQTGKELRTVECMQIHDYVRGMVYWQMPDTGEHLGDRKMDVTERQAALPLKDKLADEPPSKIET